MHSSGVRLQNTFGFFTTVTFFVAALTALSALLYPSSPTANINLRNVKVRTGRPHYTSTKPQEYLLINFDLDADLTSLFNWNTKQVFAYLTVLYNSPSASSSPSKYTENEMILWDTIIPDVRSAKLHLVNEQAKYKANDITGKFAERNATVRFEWNVQPHVGVLYWGSIEADAEGNVVRKVEEGRRGKWGFQIPPAWGKKPVVKKTAV
ncbi:signal peptidase 22 kDa subunit [Ascodesmis nigricans]|uniref:Signal peptidase subunit 3 n=1 Tax=Ascodesmis nigricans TaxID=341454 RepID=A0A4S2N6S9_9PEZI|nr:signal peptidase 22 kDa subunit [Ascodesmis nigricans]